MMVIVCIAEHYHFILCMRIIIMTDLNLLAYFSTLSSLALCDGSIGTSSGAHVYIEYKL